MTDKENEELQVITTIDEEGNEVNLRLLDIVIVDDQEYALLADNNEIQDPGGEEEYEVVLMRLKKEGEEYIFETIDDDDEFDLVSQAILDEAEGEEETTEEE